MAKQRLRIVMRMTVVPLGWVAMFLVACAGGAARETDGGSDGAGGSGGELGSSGGGPAMACGFRMPNPVASGLPLPASYDTSQAGMVSDLVTGLVWERQMTGRSAATGCTLDGSNTLACPHRYATMYCAANRLGGYSDWRLPTVIELVSLVDFTAQFPAVDGTAFPATPFEPTWSSTRGAGGALDYAWYVNFDFGGLSRAFIDEPHRVRCLRGGGSGSPLSRCYQTASRFQIAGGDATDAATGLTWQAGMAAGAGGFQAAVALCTAIGGGERLPSIKELLTLVDFTRSPLNGPLIDTTVFGRPDTFTWSSTLALGEFMSAWSFDFNDGATVATPFSNGIGEARCVR